MKGLRYALLVMLACAAVMPARAANVTVTVTAQDANGNKYANGTITATLFTTDGQTPTTPGGVVVTSSGPNNLDGTGSGSFVITDTSTITPAGSVYQFTVCGNSVFLGPAVNIQRVCFTTAYTTVIGPGPVDISTIVNDSASLLGPNFQGGGGGISWPITSPSPNPASTGMVRFANGDLFGLRNRANNGNCTWGSSGAASGNSPADLFAWSCGGFKGSIFGSGASNSAASGLFRLAPSEAIKWRNNGNTLDLPLGIGSADQLTFNGISVRGLPTWYSVADYGATPLLTLFNDMNGAAAGTSGSKIVTLSSSEQLATGGGVALYGLGSPTALSTPAAPTVTPVGAGGPLSTGKVVNAPAQATTTVYQIWACDKDGGCTIASANGQTTTGDAALGLHTATITSSARSGSTVTVTLSGAAASLASQMRVHALNSTDSTFSGYYSGTMTVIDSTHFSYVQGYDTAYGASTASTGGTVDWWIGNHITWTHDAAYFHCVKNVTDNYLVGCSRPNTANYTEDYLDDWGPATQANAATGGVPSWAATPGKADALITTCVSGCGTTTITVADAVITTSASAIAAHDDCQPLKSAAAAAKAAGGQLLIPPGTWAIGSYCALPSSVPVVQQGTLLLNGTLVLSGASNNYDALTFAPGTGSGFGFATGATTLVRNAYPGFLLSVVQSSLFQGLNVQGNDQNFSPNLKLLMMADGVTLANTFRNMALVTGTNDTDRAGIAFVGRSADNSGWGDNTFSYVAMGGGTDQAVDRSWVPAFICENVCQATIDNPSGGTRSSYYFTETGATAGLGIFFTGTFHDQGPIQPLFITDGTFGTASFNGLVADSSSVSLAEFQNGFSNYVSMTYPVVSSEAHGVTPIITGGTIGFIHAVQANGPLGQNHDNDSPFGGGSVMPNGATPGVTRAGGDYFNYNPIIGNSKTPMAFPATCGTLGLSVSAGGAVPVGPHTYSYAPYFSNGSGIPCGSATATTTGGNQTVTATIPNPIPAALGYNFYRDGGAIGACEATPFGTLTCVDAAAGTDGGVGVASMPSDGSYHYGADGYRVPAGQHFPTPFANVPACTSVLEGTAYWVNDSSTATFMATVTGGGANKVYAICDGTNWKVH